MVKGAGAKKRNKKRDFVVRGVVLFPEDIEVVKAVMQELALSEKIGFSPALRYIIREWARMREKEDRALGG